MIDGGRQSFRPDEPVVAVRHVRLDGNTLLAPGDVLPGWCAPHHVLGLFRRSMVGMVGCPWTEVMLKHAGVEPVEAAVLAPRPPETRAARKRRVELASAQETSEAAG